MVISYVVILKTLVIAAVKGEKLTAACRLDRKSSDCRKAEEDQ